LDGWMHGKERKIRPYLTTRTLNRFCCRNDLLQAGDVLN
jgi:hypothetical protein